ncbi:MAG: aminoglycoside phosphotransferase family protein [Anaerolineae bacterium]|nr:aminoglycoside phosphotransferase family protein [Anaerolineae bacterium]
MNLAHSVEPLLDYLDRQPRLEQTHWEGWQLSALEGGRNNHLIRATRGRLDWVVKFTVRDARDRAGREFAALQAVKQAGLALAPDAIWFDRDHYTQPVVVQSWVAGEVSAAPPDTDEAWRRLIEHLAQIHTITPETTTIPLQTAVMQARTPAEGLALVDLEIRRLPEGTHDPAVTALYRRLASLPAPKALPVRTSLCRVDNNIQNFIRRPGRWVSVDWENAGWADPAFGLAELMAHAAYIDVPESRWPWVVETYTALAADRAFPLRAWYFYRALIVWWAARLARYLYEIPRRLDPRLAQWPVDWKADFSRKYEHYLERATRVLESQDIPRR